MSERDSSGRFLPGNRAAVKHGGYATVALKGRVNTLAEELRQLVPAYTASDEPIITVAALKFERFIAACSAMRKAKTPEELERLDKMAATWGNAVSRDLDRLGMTPTSRAKLGLTMVRAHEAIDHGIASLAEKGRETDEHRPRELE